MNKIQDQSVAASSALNKIVKDLDNIQGSFNLQNSFNLETTPISPNRIMPDKYRISDYIQDKDHFEEFEKERNNHESFAMTHRQSNEDLHSNNLFETLQGNLDQFKHEIVINANDYVSFKQNSNNKNNFIVEGSQFQF